MNRAPLLLASAVLLAPLSYLAMPAASAAVLQSDDALKPVASRAELPITAVSVYRARAAVTRAADCTLAQGVHELRVGPLPEFADLDSVQARIGAGGKLLDVKTETVALPAPSSDNPRIRQALTAVNAARADLAEVTRRIANNEAAQKTIDSIAAKVAGDASAALGGALDPQKLGAQLSFISSERDRLSTERLVFETSRKSAEGKLAAAERELAKAGGAPPAERYALVTVAVPEGGIVPVALTYLVANATWKPAYTVRGDPAAGTLAIEFDAVVKQATGEDWKDVALVLSTAQPTRAANPSDLSPIYVDAYEPGMLPAVGSAMPPPAAPMESGDATAYRGKANRVGQEIDSLAADAEVGGSGAAVEYRLPRTFSAPSDASGERRTRVANIDGKPIFALVARPAAETDVFVRARLTNESGFILLPGQARVYLGSDSIGTVALGEIAVGGKFELWFGKEPGVTVKRELVSKKASESGVFSKTKGIDREYRISLVNTLARPVEVELWDRVPVSRNEQVKVELTGIAPALATNAEYTKDDRPQGLLKWVLALPPRAEGKEATPTTVSWKTRVTWPEGMYMYGDLD
ncbi:MAG: hypothetical protein RLY21_1351 [Planctomycetota bacterium]